VLQWRRSIPKAPVSAFFAPSARTIRRALLAGALAAATARRIRAQALRVLRIATGGIAGTYYAVGSAIAAVISAPPGGRACGEGGSCGVPGLVATVISSHGSVANVELLEQGEVETGFVQADVAHFALTGTGPFTGRPRRRLRGLAKLYDEVLHLVVMPDSGIRGPRDLPGKRISLDEPGSGTLVDVRLLLGAFGVREERIRAVYVKPDEALDLMRKGELDGFFVMAGYPTPSVVEAVERLGAVLVPIGGPAVDRLLADWPFFLRHRIPAGTYAGLTAVPTVGVGALWLCRDGLEDDLAYGLLRALFHPASRSLLERAHPRAADIRPGTALEGMTAPLHPGAVRYYADHGLLER